MGHLLNWLEARAPRCETARLLYGLGVALALPFGWSWLARTVERRTPWPMQALLLKPMFAGRALLQAGRRVEVALEASDLAQARAELRSLVSRPTSSLDAALIAAAAIESTAENLVDSWLAPLLAYSVFGLGGAYAYRAVNTADAMWGYHTPRYEQLGKAAARLDDLLNFVPARLGALMLCAVAGQGWRAAMTTWLRDGFKTASPNAGQTMACAAGALGVRLEKVGHYALGDAEKALAPSDIRRAELMVWRIGGLAIVLAVLGRICGSVRHD